MRRHPCRPANPRVIRRRCCLSRPLSPAPTQVESHHHTPRVVPPELLLTGRSILDQIAISPRAPLPDEILLLAKPCPLYLSLMGRTPVTRRRSVRELSDRVLAVARVRFNDSRASFRRSTRQLNLELLERHAERSGVDERSVGDVAARRFTHRADVHDVDTVELAVERGRGSRHRR